MTLAYFTTGDLRSRIAEAWRRYRGATVLYAATGVAYVVVLRELGPQLQPPAGRQRRLGRGHHQHGLQRLPARPFVGGPLQWDKIGQFSLASPNDAIVLASVVVWRAGAPRDPSVAGPSPARLVRCRRSSSAATSCWSLAGRVSFVGALISLDFRYQGELAAVTAVALACATMPILGARDRVEVRGASELLDHPNRVAAATAAVAVLSLVSSTTYVTYWSDDDEGPALLRPPAAGGSARPRSRSRWWTPRCPGFVMWELGYPGNLLSHLLLPYASHADYRDVATDHLNVVDSSGPVVPAVVTGVRQQPARAARVLRVRRAGQRPVRSPRTDPSSSGLVGADGLPQLRPNSPVVVTAGDATYSTVLQARRARAVLPGRVTGSTRSRCPAWRPA